MGCVHCPVYCLVWPTRENIKLDNVSIQWRAMFQKNIEHCIFIEQRKLLILKECSVLFYCSVHFWEFAIFHFRTSDEALGKCTSGGRHFPSLSQKHRTFRTLHTTTIPRTKKDQSIQQLTTPHQLFQFFSLLFRPTPNLEHWPPKALQNHRKPAKL